MYLISYIRKTSDKKNPGSREIYYTYVGYDICIKMSHIKITLTVLQFHHKEVSYAKTII
jgi:hypothetical protein